MRVAVVGDDDAGRQRDDVVAVVPLLALRFPLVATRLHEAQRLQAERVLDDVEQMALVGTDVDAVVAVGTGAVAADLIGDFAKGGTQIAIAEGEHRVEVHRGTALRHQAADHARGGAVPEQLLRDLEHRLPRGALAHADEDDTVADRRAVRLIAVAPPDGERAVPEPRVEPVDRALQQRLGAARRPVHRVDGDAVVDPARRIALEQRVGDRRHDEVGRAVRPGEHRRSLALRRVEDRDAPDQVLGELRRRHLVEPRAQDRSGELADVVHRDAPIEHPGAGVRIDERLGEEIVQLEHLDAALAHLEDEVVVILLRFVHPEHIVEEQRLGVAGRQPLVRQARPADHHRSQRADFAMDSNCVHGSSHFAATKSAAFTALARRCGWSDTRVRHWT